MNTPPLICPTCHGMWFEYSADTLVTLKFGKEDRQFRSPANTCKTYEAANAPKFEELRTLQSVCHQALNHPGFDYDKFKPGTVPKGEGWEYNPENPLGFYRRLKRLEKIIR